jgi:hypothetical protein
LRRNKKQPKQKPDQSFLGKMKTLQFILCSSGNTSKISSLSKGVFFSACQMLFVLPARAVFHIRR